MEIFKQGEAELQFEDDRKNETITLTMDPVKGKVVYKQIAFHAIIMIQKNKEALIHRFMVLQKNFYEKINYGYFPKNYRPKRSKKVMPLMLHLDKEIKNLHAFLNAPS